MTNYTNVSKYLSMILRHKPEAIGITLDAHGWADVNELIQGIAKTYTFNKDILETIVRTDAKQRYAFNDDHTKIRANQGHSVPVDLELTPVPPPDVLYHGTGEKYTASIDQTGLQPKQRLHVHLSKDVATAKTIGFPTTTAGHPSLSHRSCVRYHSNQPRTGSTFQNLVSRSRQTGTAFVFQSRLHP